MSKQARRRWWNKINRELVLIGVGLGLTTLAGLGIAPNRPELYPLYAGMMGLGSVLRYAEKKQRDKDNGQ